MADKRKKSKSESEAADSNSIFDLFEAPPERDPNSFGKIPVVKEDEIDLTEGASPEVKAAADAEAAGLQHWTAPPTGQVPAVLNSETEDRNLWADMKGPSWHGDDPSWSGPDLADVFADTDSVNLGASLDEFENDIDDDDIDDLHQEAAVRRPVRSNGSATPPPDPRPLATDSRPTASDSRATASDSRATASDSRATASDSRATASDSRATASDSRATASDSRATASDSRPSGPDSRPAAPAPRPAAQTPPQPRPRPVTERPARSAPRPRAVPEPAAADQRPVTRPAPETVRLESNPPVDGVTALAPTADGLAVPPAIRRTQQIPPADRSVRSNASAPLLSPASSATAPPAPAPAPTPGPTEDRFEPPSRRPALMDAEPSIEDIEFDDGEEEYYEEEVHEDGLDYGPIGGRNLPQAIGVGVALASVVLAAMFFGPETTLALIVIMALLAVMELYNAMRMAGLRPATLLGIVGTAAAPAAAFYRGDAAFPLIVGLTVVFGTLWYLVGADTERPVLNLSLTMMGIFWVGGLAAFGALMIQLDGGIELLLAAIIITVASDTMAYIGGRAYGSRPFHHASPNKTWEGTITGFVGAMFAGFAIGVTEMGTIWDTNLVPAIALGAVVGLLAPMGDLAESVVKRDLGVKDMGTLLPGHGGVLDRVDGLLFALPGAYYLALVYGII